MSAAPFVARVSRAKLTGLVVLSVIMSAAAVFAVQNTSFDHKPIAHVAGWFGLVFFPLCGLGIARQLFRTGPVMEIGPQGLMWKRWSDETIPWSAFSRAEPVTVVNQQMLSLWLIDPDAWRSTKLLGRLAGANKGMGYGDISLTMQGTDRSFREMVDAVRGHAPQLFGHG